MIIQKSDCSRPLARTITDWKREWSEGGYTTISLANIMSEYPDTDPHWAVVEHFNRHLLFFLVLLMNRNLAGVLRTAVWLLDKPLKSLCLVELQEYGGAAGVALDLHAQDAIAWPLLTYVLQTVDGWPREGDVDVGQNEEHKQGLVMGVNA